MLNRFPQQGLQEGPMAVCSMIKSTGRFEVNTGFAAALGPVDRLESAGL